MVSGLRRRGGVHYRSKAVFLLEEKESHDHDLAHDVPQPSNLSVCVCVFLLVVSCIF